MKTDLFIHRYYKIGMNPFKSISDLSYNETIDFMKKKFPNHRCFHANPKERIKNRKKIEKWLYEKFVCAGGVPKTNHPCYFTLGKSSFVENFESFDGKSSELKMSLNLFSSKNISFTYPDSFFFEWLGQNKGHKLFNIELNNKVFTLDEILVLLNQDKIPESVYMDTPNYKYHFYIEAQVWDYEILHNNSNI